MQLQTTLCFVLRKLDIRKKISVFQNYNDKYFIDASMSNFWTCSMRGTQVLGQGGQVLG